MTHNLRGSQLFSDWLLRQNGILINFSRHCLPLSVAFWSQILVFLILYNKVFDGLKMIVGCPGVLNRSIWISMIETQSCIVCDSKFLFPCFKWYKRCIWQDSIPGPFTRERYHFPMSLFQGTIRRVRIVTFE